MHPDTLPCNLCLLCLLCFQERDATCLSCWVADWLASALHEGRVKGQERLHDPAQSGNHQPPKAVLQTVAIFSNPRPPAILSASPQELSYMAKLRSSCWKDFLLQPKCFQHSFIRKHELYVLKSCIWYYLIHICSPHYYISSYSSTFILLHE